MPMDNRLPMEQLGQIGEDVVTACRILSHRRLDGDKVSGTPEAPLEIHIHSCLYCARPDVGAIARTHSFAASVFAAMGRAVGVVHDFGAILLGDIPVFPRSELIETKELGDELAALIGSRSGALLRGNGAAIVGSDTRQACLRPIFLEESAALQLHRLPPAHPSCLTAYAIQSPAHQ